MRAHKHAAHMAAYAKDAAETDKPWERWEWTVKNCAWATLTEHPTWDTDSQYRRKPRTVHIGAFEVPAPLRAHPVKDTAYYVPCLTDRNTLWACNEWWDDSVDREYLRRGLVHLTKEAAEEHARALLSFTENLA